jgi:cytochrome c oxidase cbb3-type subunit III
MSDFTSSFWSWWIIAIAGGGIVWCYWLLTKNKNMPIPVDEQGKPMHHIWDGDLQELNNPMPRWWIILFYITIVFAVFYLALYPGLGSFKGLLGWTEVGQYNKEVKKAEEKYGPLYDKYLKQDLLVLAANKKAMKTGERLFETYCTACHGSDARGARGFPNLRDNDWLYGGDPETIQTTILHGRNGAMPAWGPTLGKEGVNEVAHYVKSLSSGKVDDPALVAKGKAKFATFCAGCHMPNAKGNHAIGAPNLTDNIWLYGGSLKTIKYTITHGRNGHMPAHEAFLGKAKVHILAAYIYSLSHESK